MHYQALSALWQRILGWRSRAQNATKRRGTKIAKHSKLLRPPFSISRVICSFFTYFLPVVVNDGMQSVRDA